MPRIRWLSWLLLALLSLGGAPGCGAPSGKDVNKDKDKPKPPPASAR